jgi:hypothetical protein
VTAPAREMTRDDHRACARLPDGYVYAPMVEAEMFLCKLLKPLVEACGFEWGQPEVDNVAYLLILLRRGMDKPAQCPGCGGIRVADILPEAPQE